MSPDAPYSIEPTADGCPTLFSHRYGQTYHSRYGALTEALHVFVQGAGVGERLDAGLPTRVLEVGFGAGLNFLASAHRAATAQTRLHYVALEMEVPAGDLLARLDYGTRLGSPALAEAFVAWRQSLPERVPPGVYSGSFEKLVTLSLWVGDATTRPFPPPPFDAVYLDAFSPDVNPELWTPSFCERLYGVLHEGGRLATYSVRSSVRHSLSAAGFTVHKRPGPPGKRNVLLALR